MNSQLVSVLVRLGERLRASGYSFVTVTPETHRRVLARPVSVASRSERRHSLTDVFGWSRSFDARALPDDIVALLREGELLDVGPDGYKSRVRYASLDGALFAHSAYPTAAADAVFFGPDTYRFCRALEKTHGVAAPPRVVVDVGCGSGAGGLVVGRDAATLILADVNPRALDFARANARLNGQPGARVLESDLLASVDVAPDLVVANPPYLVDPLARTYRDGGGSYGEALAVRLTREALGRLAPGGRLLLYTGAAIVDGVDTLREAVTPLLEDANARFRYEEIDPDVFGEELSTPAYAAVDRIAAVWLEATCSG